MRFKNPRPIRAEVSMKQNFTNSRRAFDPRASSFREAPVPWPVPANPLHRVSATAAAPPFQIARRSRHRCGRSEQPTLRVRRERIPGQYPSSAEFR